MSSFFSGSETALMSLNRLRVHHLVEKGTTNAFLIDKLLSNPNKLLSTILVGNNLVNIGASALATSISLRLFGQAGVGIAIGVLTVLILIFSEVTPKTYAATNNEKFALKIAPLINLAQLIFYPVVKLLGIITNILLKVLRVRSEINGITITEEEIMTLVSLGKNQGSIEPSEEEMITSVFDLNDILVRELMIPRVDIIGIPIEASLKEAWNTIVETDHSRVPIYKGSLDNIVGVLYSKDLIKYVYSLENGSIKDIIRQPYYVPETKRISELLRELRRERIHIAIVLDEYGGTAGLAFLEDLIETIIGTIGDEYDDLLPLIVETQKGVYTVDSKVSLEEVNQLMNIDLPQEEHDTIGGLIFHLFGYIPSKGETIEFSDVSFTVNDVEKNRIKRIVIKSSSEK